MWSVALVALHPYIHCLAVHVQPHDGLRIKSLGMKYDFHSILLEVEVRACSVEPTLGFHATGPST
jgi:hypothetical protein